MGQPGPDKKLRVLVIDEDPAGGRLIRLGLSGTGCQVMASTRPTEGPRLVQQHGPDLVLLNVHFGDRSSVEIAAKIMEAALAKQTAVAFLSEEESVSQRFRAIQLGALEYIFKPSDAAKLNKHLKAVLSGVASARHQAVTGPAREHLVAALEDVEKKAFTGTMSFKRSGMNASIRFAFGEVQQAECGVSTGDAALNEIARHGDWNHELKDDGPGTIKAPEPEIPTPAKSTPRPKPRRGAFKDIPTVLEKPPPPSRPKPKPPPGLDPMDSGIDAVLEPEPALDGMTSVADDQPTVVESDPLSLAQQLQAAAPVPGPAALAEAGTEEEPAVPEMYPDDGMDEIFPGDYDEEAPTLLVDEPTPSVTSEGPSKAVLERMEEMARDRAGVSSPTPPEDTAAGFPEGLQIPAASMEPADREQLREYLVRYIRRPLLLAVNVKDVRDLLQREAEKLGFSVIHAESGQETWNITHQQRPIALLSDLHLGDVDGRELLAAVRSDFIVRETPFLILSGADLDRQIKTEGQEAVDPVLRGLESVLGPRIKLYHHLFFKPKVPAVGWVEPIGICNLLRTFSDASMSGRLLFRFGEQRNAEVTFQRGQICGATVNAPQASVGPLALLHLVGLEWKEFYFAPDEGGRGRVPLGEVQQLLDASSQQNATLMAGLYQYGVKLEDVIIDNTSMNSYLQALPTSSLDVLIRLSEGEPPAELIQDGIGAPGQLKSLLFDMRRKGVIKPTSLKPLRSEDDSEPEIEVPESEPVAEAPVVPNQYQRKGPARWVVVLVAGAVTVILAAGGYLVYQYLISGTG